jgi:predicted RNase H-like HicB family nuclease
MKYLINIHKSEYGYDSHAPALPGCHSQGDTEQEALENIKDAIKVYLESELIINF